MRGASSRIACWLVSLTLLLSTESLARQAAYKRRSPSPTSRVHEAGGSHRQVFERQTGQPDFSASISGDSVTFGDPSSRGTSYNYYYSTFPVPEGYGAGGVASTASSPSGTLPPQAPAAQPTLPSTSTATTSVAFQSPTAASPMASQSSTVQSCDKAHTKFEINRLLIDCEAKLKNCTASILLLAHNVTVANRDQIASQLAPKIQQLGTILQSYVRSIQSCGNDRRPLSSDQGVSISDVSWSAFQVVLTLKPVFQCVTKLYQPFPAIKSICTPLFSSLSTALAAIIGACGIQINLFETRFMPLVSPQLKEFTDIGDDFASFVGSFES